LVSQRVCAGHFGALRSSELGSGITNPTATLIATGPQEVRMRPVKAQPRVRQNSRLSLLQLNAHKSQHSLACLTALLHSANTQSICMVQEPWHWKGVVSGLKGPNHTLFQSQVSSDVAPRAALCCSNELKPVFLPHLSDKDIVCVQIQLTLASNKAMSVVVVSAYLPGDEPVPEEHFRKISDFCLRTKSELLLGSDANSHSVIFGSSDTNVRGETLVQLVAQLDWHFLNQGESPTFVTASRSEVLDVTLCSTNLLPFVSDWRVSDETVLSDHRLIWLSLYCVKVIYGYKRNIRKTDWEKYEKCLSSSVKESASPLTSSEAIEAYARSLEEAIISSFHAACPRKRVSGRRAPPWWNSETAPQLIKLKQQARKAFKCFMRCKSPEAWEASKAASRLYMSHIWKAKRETWRKFCYDIETSSEASRITKVLRAGPRHSVGLLRLPSGQMTTTTEETVRHLLDVHFPNCVLGGLAAEAARLPTAQCEEVVNQVVTMHSVEGAIRSLSI